MIGIISFLLFSMWSQELDAVELVFQEDMNFRIEPGGRTCFFERGKSGQVMEAQYQVIDGEHGDLDISFQIFAPDGSKLLDDYKQPENAVILELDADGDYTLCMDNSYSVMNSKLVFVYVLIEDKPSENDEEAMVSVVEDGVEQAEEQILQFMGTLDNGEPYYVEVTHIIDSLMRTLSNVVKARHLLSVYAATKSRDSYSAFKDTNIVDMWSGLQISIMCLVGLIQVYMIKKLFNGTSRHRFDF